MIKKLLIICLSTIISISILTSCGKQKKAESPILNFTQPITGEEIAVFTIKNYGEIKIKLFPEIAPLAVENFMGLIENGYYDELILYFLNSEECIKTGDPRGDGTGGQSFIEGSIPVELSASLRNFSGAIGFINDLDTNYSPIDYTINSKIYIINTEKDNGLTDNFFEKSVELGFVFPKNVKEKYKEVGGAPYYDGGYTVFGQIFQGMNVIYEINKASVDKNYKPNDQIKIEKAEIIVYEERLLK